MRSRLPIGALACLCLLATGTVRAQPAIDAQLLKAPPGGLAGWSLPSPEVASHGQLTWGGRLDHAQRPLRLSCLQPGDCPDDARSAVALARMSDLQLSVSAGLFDAVEVGLSFGAALVRGANVEAERTTPASGVVATDLRGAAKFPLLRGPLWLSLFTELSVPTGNQVRFAGEAGFTLLPALLVGYRLGPVQLTGLGGLFLRRDTRFGGLPLRDELRLSAGADLRLSSSAGAFVESHGRLAVGAGPSASAQRSIESALGMRIDVARGLRLRIGAGSGAWPAQGYGASDYRLLLDLRLRTGPAEPGARARCQPGDGACGASDSDADGVPDGQDRCPGDAEDRDGFADDDGCPDLDDDADGVPDAEDRCPTRSEDRDGHQDADGCPDVDNDGDGLADGLDDCPAEPEDHDGFEDDDGCPESGPERVAVTVTDTRILVSDRVYFEPGEAVLRAVSLPALDEVARAILALPADRHVRVEGHTDELGSADHNRELSFQRARAVLEYLVSRGVPPQRLSHVGRGASRPLVEASSPEARAMNRRVEFQISGQSSDSHLENKPDLAD